MIIIYRGPNAPAGPSPELWVPGETAKIARAIVCCDGPRRDARGARQGV